MLTIDLFFNILNQIVFNILILIFLFSFRFKSSENQNDKKSSGVDSSDEEYCVEKILGKRVISGKTEYFLKWKGYPDEENCWEHEENLECDGIINEYENSLVQKITKKEEKKQENVLPVNNTSLMAMESDEDDTISLPEDGIHHDARIIIACYSSDTERQRSAINEQFPIPEEKIPDAIIGATQTNDGLHFLLKWKNSERADLISASEANIRFPQAVIEYYEERLYWKAPLDIDDLS